MTLAFSREGTDELNLHNMSCRPRPSKGKERKKTGDPRIKGTILENQGTPNGI